MRDTGAGEAPLAIHRFNQVLWIAERGHGQGIFSDLIAAYLQCERLALGANGNQEGSYGPS